MTEQAFALLVVNDVVQIDPAYDDRFGGCLMTVTEKRPWGAQGFVRIPARGDAYYRCPFDSIAYVGQPAWVYSSELEHELEPNPAAHPEVQPGSQLNPINQDLLEACRAIVFVNENGLTAKQMIDAVRLCERAIAKAEGQGIAPAHPEVQPGSQPEQINQELLDELKAARETLHACSEDVTGTPSEESFRYQVRCCDRAIAKAEGRNV